jgi:flagellar basal-body rod modification protein FlgD
MAAATGIWTGHPASHGALGARTSAVPGPLAGPANGNNGDNNDSSGNSATISANDFLTLLVTEMQNQDPTDDTDPNEYIDQLVQVNSLEQLIDINQNLSTALGITNTSTSGDAAPGQVSGQVTGAAAGLTSSTSAGAPSIVHPAANKASALGQVQSAAAAGATSSAAASPGSVGVKTAPGNLGIPEARPAARRVAEALGGRIRAQ